MSNEDNSSKNIYDLHNKHHINKSAVIKAANESEQT